MDARTWWRKSDDKVFVTRSADDPDLDRKYPHSSILRWIGRLDVGHDHVELHIDEILIAANMLNNATQFNDIIEKLSKRARRTRTELKKIAENLKREYDEYEEQKAQKAAFGEAWGGANPFGAAQAGNGPQASRASVHADLARLTLDGLEGPICFSDRGMFAYRDGVWELYRAKNETEVNIHIETWVHAAVNKANAASGRDRFDDTAELRAETRKFIRTMPELSYTGAWDAHGLTPLANGLFDRRTKTLRPYAREDRATWRMAVPYDPAAKFDHGRQMFADMFKGSTAYVRLMQEKYYVAIFMEGRQIGRALRRATYFHGPANSGKSGPVDLVYYVIGAENCCSTPMEALAEAGEARFSAASVLESHLWAVNEATQESTRLPAARIKALFDESMVSSDVKIINKRMTGRYLASSFFSSNSPPRTRDSADGFSDRFDLISCREAFDPEKPVGVALLAAQAGYSTPAEFVFATEGAGLLNWALEVGEHMEAVRAFTYPKRVREAREDIADNANPIRTFARECIEEADTGALMTTGDIYEVYRQRFEEEHGGDAHAMSPKNFWSLLNGVYAGKRGSVPKNVASVRHGATVAAGLKFTEYGLELWRRADEALLQAPSFSRRKKAFGFSGKESLIVTWANSQQKAKIDTHFQA